MRTLRVEQLAAEVAVDGQLDEPVWQRITPISGFIQTEPNLGAPASEETEVLIFYDQDNIYFGFRCHDSEPEKIIHRLGAHDGVTNSDSVDLFLDTFHDRRTGYYFSINSRGIQFDAISSETGSSDFLTVNDPTWDGIWYSAAKLQPWGWSAEVVIPFKSIRLSHSSRQSWGLNITRDLVRKNEKSSWQPVSRFDGFMRPSKAGTLTGLENVRVGRNLELIPFFSTRYRQSDWLPDSDGGHATGGLDLRYGLTQNLTLSLTGNPDFGETEADEFATEISRFEIFFPEKRKFFTEGANYFRTPIDVFFSRRVGARLADGEPQRIFQGGKLTGKTGRWTLGLLEAATQRTEFVDPGDGLAKIAPAAFFGVLRVQRDILEKSAIGFVSSNRFQNGVLFDAEGELVSQRENTHGVDLSILSGENLTWRSQFLANQNATRPGFSGQHLGAFSEINYNSERLAIEAGFRYLGRDFDVRSTGFEPTTDRVTEWADVTWKPFLGRWGIRQIFAQLNYDGGNDTSGALQESGADADLRVQFKNFWSVRARYSYDRVRWNEFTPTFTALPTTRLYVTPRLQLFLNTNENRMLSLNFRYLDGGLVQFDENFFGYQRRFEGTVTARLGDHLRLQLGGAHVREYLNDGTHFQNRDFLLSRWNYQFTPKLRARVLAQYAADRHGRNLSVNSLLAYDFTSRSALFVGYNRQRNTPLDPADLGNEVFVKLSYLFAF